MKYEKLRNIFKIHNITMVKLAKELDICIALLYRKLNGENDWRFSEVIKISDMTGYSLDELRNIIYENY